MNSESSQRNDKIEENEAIQSDKELKWTHKLSTETGINYQELNKLLKADESVRWCHQVLAIKVCMSKYQELKTSIRIHVPLSWINLLSVFFFTLFLVDVYGRPRVKIMHRRLGTLRLATVIARYRDLLVSRRSIICLRIWLRQRTDPPLTENTRSFA